MKDILIPNIGWRGHLLALLSIMALVLLSGETASTASFLITKSLGFGICYIIYRLAKYWDGKGKINKLAIEE